MAMYEKMSVTELSALKEELLGKYADFKAKNLKLDMSRGKPGANQLDLSMELFEAVNEKNGFMSENGFDCRNYGVLDGIPECKRLFAQILETEEKNVIIGGNSSLNMMFDYIAQCMTHGSGAEPWMLQGKVKFLCPAPGYDRHFGILEHFGIEMITVPMLESGPDMDKVEECIKDEKVKGMFCVPKYSNPEGTTYSDETVKRIAAMKPAAKDFRLMWDNAYCVHHLAEEHDELLNILDECAKTGNGNMPIVFTSTSKISFPGAGVAALAASDSNISEIKKRMTVQTIGYDKLNQLRHARYFKDLDGINEYMIRHAAILKPKFDAVLAELEKQLGGTGIAQWNEPRGGYFISLNVMNGCAKRTAALCAEAGVVLTPAGATFPYGNDPKDSNIRIAPSFPPVEELKLAAELLCLCTKIACVEKLLSE